MYGVFGGAALVGALAYGAFGHRLPRRLTFVCAFAVVPIVYLTMATLPSLPVALVALAVSGLAAGPINPLINTVQFELVPPELRGRVFGAVKAGAWAAIPLGVLLGGAIVEAVGVARTFLGIGICYLAVTLYGFFNPAFREMDRRPGEAVEPAQQLPG
jgi:predicted MFS family arabinose efflux permease